MQLVPYNLAPIISLFLKRDVNKALVGEKVYRGAGYGSRVSTSLAFARKRSGQPDYVSTTSMDQSLTSTR